ncbi:DUF192 domain-containing protein [Methanotorris formicicus]|uniref:DUF192 domain-containing protein n=1 Tax=Methanotorris formicicus Mc-S-70 TaxID=647171 RepID=H1KXB4_9EURY|nr:DUF192 domain-containing protein [Methanotorris formicicus]EHP88326.1 protein of unknown function DUF192 [Methanotorris formicicus Mc-S-70]
MGRANEIKRVKLGDKEYKIILADNFLKRAFGLMMRDIGDDEGMLFLYNNRKLHIHTFFMRYPIDVIFFKDGEVVEVVKNLKPWKTYKCKNYSNAMLEIKSGNIDIEGLLGKKVKLD